MERRQLSVEVTEALDRSMDRAGKGERPFQIVIAAIGFVLGVAGSAVTALLFG